MALVSIHGRRIGFDSDTDGIVQNGRIRGALRKTTIANALVLALNATAQIIVPAPGAGLAIYLNRIFVSKIAGTAFAGIAAGEDLVAKYSNAAGAQVSSVIETTGFLDQATAQTRYAGPPGAVTTTAADVTPVANAPLVLHLLTGEITTGNTDLIVWVDYDVLPVALDVLPLA